MNETGKTLTALFILGLAGVGVYSSGKWVMDEFNKAGESPAPVVKKRSPVKPDNLGVPRSASEKEAVPERETYTFFETLNDSSMTKIAGLEGGILSTLEKADPPAVRHSEPRRVVKVSSPVRTEAPVVAQASERTQPALAANRKVPESTVREARPEDPLYAVQVSSFKDSLRARVLEDKLKEMGYEAFQLAAGSASEGNVRHRVYLGKYNDRKSADNAARKVRMQEALGGMVITLGR